MTLKQILFSIALIGFTINSCTATEQNTQRPSLRDIIQKQHSSNPNPMHVCEITKLEASGTLGKKDRLFSLGCKLSHLPHSVKELGDQELIICATKSEHENAPDIIVINPFTQKELLEQIKKATGHKHTHTICSNLNAKFQAIYNSQDLKDLEELSQQ